MNRIHFLGIPHDANSSFMEGCREGPPLVRRNLFSDAYSLWSETGVDLGAPGRLVDQGDLRFDSDVDPWTSIETAVAKQLGGGDPLICIGGDHAITHPILRGVRRYHPKLTLVHIDAHADLYPAYLDNPRSHASPFARIMEEKLVDRLIQVGLRNLNDIHRAQIERFGVEVIEGNRCGERIELDIDTPVYISLDIDSLDPAHAPGVSHREPGGLTTRQVINLIQGIRANIVGADIVEYNPRNDISDMTSGVVAKLLKEIAGVIWRNAGV